MIDSSNSSVDGGNTIPHQPRQISPAKRWCFTLNNYTEYEVSSIVPIIEDNCSLAIIGKEKGESGTPHLQGYCEFKTKLRPKNLIEINRIHWEKCKGNRDSNVRYCSKDSDILYSKGLPKTATTIQENDFYPWQRELVDIFRTPCKWDCRTIYWRYGRTNIGKTQFCKWCCVHLGAIIIGGSHKHMLAQVQNFKSDFYIILLSYGDDEISYRAVEQIKDGLFTTYFGCDNNKPEVRDAPHLLIIGNEPPNKENRHFHPDKYNVKGI